MRKYPKDSIDYQVNLATLREIEDMVPMLRCERDALRSWAKAGYDVETNPWQYTDASGCLLDYLKAYRVRNGFYRGPLEYWEIDEWYTPWYCHHGSHR